MRLYYYYYLNYTAEQHYRCSLIHEQMTLMNQQITLVSSFDSIKVHINSVGYVCKSDRLHVYRYIRVVKWCLLDMVTTL